MEVRAEVKCQNMAKSENCEKEAQSTLNAKNVGVPLEKPPKAVQTDDGKTKSEISKSEPHSRTPSSKKSEAQQIECSPSVDLWKCKENGNTHTQKTGDSLNEFRVTVSAHANPSCDLDILFYFILFSRYLDILFVVYNDRYFSNNYQRFLVIVVRENNR